MTLKQPGEAIHENKSLWIYDLVKATTRLYFNLRGFRMIDAHHIPQTGGAILSANHITGMDPFAVGQPSRRRVYFMTKKELFK
ncbi:MAG TPA: hypothetical protein VNU01_12850, partial [Egibacteraceae bacterium]|nr:hypothetical protein [Egibacteraceae bacterium]